MCYHFIHAVPTKVFLLYCKDTSLKRSHGVSGGDFCEDVLKLANILTCCGGINCSVDFYEKEQENWDLWTQKKIKDSTYVLMVCSPQLMEHLSYGGEKDVKMYKGMFFSNTIVNCIEAPKFIPIFLNGYEPRNLKSWLPAQLHASRCYRLRGLRAFYQRIDPERFGEEERNLRVTVNIQKPQFRELAELVQHSREEHTMVPPKYPAVPIPLTCLNNSPENRSVLEKIVLDSIVHYSHCSGKADTRRLLKAAVVASGIQEDDS